MSERFRDFDAFWAEQRREPVRVKVFGEVHELPPSLPAAVILRLWRMMAAGRGEDEVSPAEVLALAEAIFGRERLDGWAAQGLTFDQLQDLLRWAMEVYAGGSGDGGKPAPRPMAGKATSPGS